MRIETRKCGTQYVASHGTRCYVGHSHTYVAARLAAILQEPAPVWMGMDGEVEVWETRPDVFRSEHLRR